MDDHSHHHHHHPTSNIKVAFFLNTAFTIIEFFGGFFVNSVAIISDALHDLGDSLSLGFAWWMENYSKKKGDYRYSYGYKRFTLLSAMINSMVLVVGSVIILYEAVPRLFHPEDVDPKGMMILAILGMLVNGVAYYKTSKGGTLNEQVVSWHLLEDVLGWVAVFIVSLVLMFKYIPILDPILSILITLFILYNVVGALRNTLKVFLQHVPSGVDIQSLEKEIESLDKIQSSHQTHIWSLDGENHVLSTHIKVQEFISREEVMKLKHQVKMIISKRNIEHITIEIEYEHDDCSMHDDE